MVIITEYIKHNKYCNNSTQNTEKHKKNDKQNK